MQVLIIDDAQYILALFGKLVSDLGADPVTFLAPEDAVKWCLDNDPDLVIVDYEMPGMNGIEFITRFRQMPGKTPIPVVMVTANLDKEVRYKALNQGATDFLNKPIDQTEFNVRIRNMLTQGSMYKTIGELTTQLATRAEHTSSKLHRTERELVTRLSRAAEFRDSETGAHVNRMTHYALHIAENLGLERDQQELLFEAAPMHDIGKIAIPDNILLKPGRFTPEEFQVMKTHSQLGHDILHGSESEVICAGAEIALTHHEKFNGEGYPRGLKGKDIPLFGRIVAVADVFDALTSDRVYKKGWLIDDAVTMIREESGRHFDPDCVQAFFKRWERVLEIKEQFGDEPLAISRVA